MNTSERLGRMLEDFIAKSLKLCAYKTVIISSPSAQSLTSLTQSSIWLSVTSNSVFMDSMFRFWASRAFVVYK